MQDGTADTERISFRKRGLDGNVPVDESNAAERLRIRGVQRDSETAQRRQTIGHQSFTTCFVDGRARTIGECDIQSLAARGDGGRQPGGAASDYE
jgi:hypothetical protein